MHSRSDSLLGELAQRHGADPELLHQLRPAAERILDPGLPESDRLRLLELLAETCERAVHLRRDCARIQAGFAAMFADLAHHIRNQGR